METLADALPREQARCREMLEHALELPPQSGFFLVATLREALAQAERAAASGDVVAILRAYQMLSEFKE